MGALSKIASMLSKAAENGTILRYGSGEGRLARILETDPRMRLQSTAFPGGRSQIKAVINTPDMQHSGFMERIKGSKGVGDSTSTGAREFAEYYAPKDTDFAIAHMMGAEKGGGSSGLIYPAFGEAAAKEGRMILPDSYLTYDNIPNRSVKSIGTELSHDKPVFVPHEDQISGTGLSVSEFMKLPKDMRAAVLFKNSQDISEQRLLDAMDYGRWDSDPTRGKQFEHLIKKYNMDPSGYDMGELPYLNAEEMGPLVDQFRSLGVKNIGTDTLRRSQALRYMQEGEMPPPRVIDNLLYKEGGLVQMSQALRHVA